MPHLRVLNAAFTGAKCRIYGCQTHLVCFTCKHFVRFSFVCSGKCDIFAVGQVGGLRRKRMMPMRPCLSPRRAFCRFFQPCNQGGRVGNEARHNEGVYLTLCLRRIESRKFAIKVLNIATVDVPGVIISTPCGLMQVIVVSLRMQRVLPYVPRMVWFFISAWASDVVCSTLIGRGRASDKVVKRYDTNGRLIGKPTKGLNILKMSDGTTKKAMVK